MFLGTRGSFCTELVLKILHFWQHIFYSSTCGTDRQCGCDPEAQLLTLLGNSHAFQDGPASSALDQRLNLCAGQGWLHQHLLLTHINTDRLHFCRHINSNEKDLMRNTIDLQHVGRKCARIKHQIHLSSQMTNKRFSFKQQFSNLVNFLMLVRLQVSQKKTL